MRKFNLTKNMENYFNNMNLLQTLFKWKWHIVIICVIAVILSGIFSGPTFIKPKYKSTAIIYPSNIAPYSDESETEQMIQWLNAIDIKDSIINKYDLPVHYKISRDYKYFYSTLLYEYSKNVTISKTMYESIEIEVMDTDPKIAYDIVNSILEYLNRKIRKIHQDKYEEVIVMWEKMLEKRQHEIDAVIDTLYRLRTVYEIIDYGPQAAEITKGYLGTIDGNSVKNVNMDAVLRFKKNIEERGGDFQMYNTRMYDLLRLYSELQRFHDLAYYDANKEFTYTNIVSEPVIADKKSYPVRWLIVFYSVAATIIMSVVVILIIEGRHNVAIAKQKKHN